MRQMQRWMFVLALTILSLGAYAQTEKGISSAGFTIGYGFGPDAKNATLGLDYRYNILDEVRISPSLAYFVKNDGLSAWAIDLNAHYVVQLSDMFGFYPLGGLSLSFWDVWGYNATRFGVNIGLGGELYATKEITVGVEFKYNAIKDFHQPMLGVRVGYSF